jgi:hypothetical protein
VQQFLYRGITFDPQDYAPFSVFSTPFAETFLPYDIDGVVKVGMECTASAHGIVVNILIHKQTSDC